MVKAVHGGTMICRVRAVKRRPEMAKTREKFDDRAERTVKR